MKKMKNDKVMLELIEIFKPTKKEKAFIAEMERLTEKLKKLIDYEKNE